MFVDLACAVVALTLLFFLAFRWKWVASTQSLAYGAVIVFSLVHQLIYRTIVEDAYIGFRFSRNLARGFGLVFNPGERVEGYSNFSWSFFLGFLNRWFGVDIPLTAAVLGVILTVAGVCLTFRLAAKLSGSGSAGLAAGLLTAAAVSFSSYGPSGLEEPLFCVLILLVFFALSRDNYPAAGFLVAVAIATRPDGAIVCVPVLAHILLARKNTTSEKMKFIAVAAAAGAIVIIPWTIWRVSFYGYFLPNALAAKLGMDKVHELIRGLSYIVRFTVAHLTLMAALAVSLAALFMRPLAEYPTVLRSMAVFVIAYAAFIIAAGGDWMPGYRFLAPIVPVSAVLVAYLGTAPKAGWWSRMFAARPGIVVASMCAYMFAISYVVYVPKFRLWDDDIHGLSEIGSWIRESLPPNTLTACFACGALPYESDLPTIDMLGLCDEHIARHGRRKPLGAPGHISYDYDYVASRRPAVVAFLGGQGFQPNPESPVPSSAARWRDYEPLTFLFRDSTHLRGKYVNLLVLRAERDELARRLERPNRIEVVPAREPRPGANEVP